MADLAGMVVRYFTIKETNIDNLVFKLFYKFTFILLFTSSMLLHLTQCFGDPINCQFAGKNSNFEEDYCWIHGSAHFDVRFQGHVDCITIGPKEAKNGAIESEQKVVTAYYQWVPFVLLLQAGSFVLPYKFWKM